MRRRNLTESISVICGWLVVASPATPTAWAADPAPAPQAAGVVNINTASIEQLKLLPAIGQAKAQRIVARRAKRAFRKVYELRRVHGIGRKIFRQVRPYVTVTGPTTLQRKIKPSQ